MKRAALAILLLTASIGAAWADCTPRKSDLDSFGVAQLGPSSLASVGAHARQTKHCFFGIVAMCAYLDGNGIIYDWMEGVIQSKEVKLSRLRNGFILPFSLTAADTTATIETKLWSRGVKLSASYDPDTVARQNMIARGIALPATPTSEEEERVRLWLTGGPCLKNAGGNVFSVWFQFDRSDHLVSFQTRLKRRYD